VATAAGSATTGTDSISSCGRTARNQPTEPLTAKIAPKMLTEAVVSIPANTSVMPKAKTIGQAVGAGSSTVFDSLLVFVGISKLILSAY
jgi:hypothetical protein